MTLYEQGSPDHHWPRCPGCGVPRQTVCPYCGEAAAAFQFVGDAPVGLEPQRYEWAEDLPPEKGELWLRCTTCDDLFAARFYRRCAWCGHVAESGIEADPPPTTGAFNPRVLLTLAILTAVLSGLFGWFYFELR